MKSNRLITDLQKVTLSFVNVRVCDDGPWAKPRLYLFVLPTQSSNTHEEKETQSSVGRPATRFEKQLLALKQK